MFFKIHGIVNDDLRSGDPEINDAIIHCLCGLTKATVTLTYKTARTYIHTFPLSEKETTKQHTWNVPRLSSKSASMDHTFRDLYTRFCTGSDESKYSAFLAGIAVAF